MNTNIGQKIWHFCHTLRDEGMSYGNYIEQLTYLLFLKMAAEKDADIPHGCTWGDLIKESGDDLMKKYDYILDTLSTNKGVLGEIFANAKNLFRKPVGLKKIIDMINDIDWGSIPVDQLGTIYEDLLQRYAEEKKGGAGQYFTPRPVIQVMCEVMKPDIGIVVHDPACGTGGFLINAFEYIVENKGGKLDPDDEEKLKYSTFTGQELVLDTRRLCVMNMFLHGIHDGIEYGDSLSEVKEAEWDMVLTNPPFGVKSGGEVPHRPDFNIETANKQLNFVQHVMSGLKRGGKAAMVLPDGVLSDSSNASIDLRKIWLKGFNVHTILRLPRGCFSHAPGVKANVVFFDKEGKTNDLWIFDLRTNIDKINKGNPLKKSMFDEFIKLYESRNETDRFKKFSLKDVEDNDWNLGIRFIEDDSLHKEYDDPDILIENIKESESEIIDSLQVIEESYKIDVTDSSDWPIKTIESVCLQKPQSGGTPRTTHPEYYGGNILWVITADMTNAGQFISETKKTITQEGLDNSTAKVFPKGTILFSMYGSIGKSCITEKEMASNQAILGIVPNNKLILTKYLYYCLQSLTEEFLSMGWGGTQDNINAKMVKNYKIPLPPLDIQQKMVDALDLFFTKYKILNDARGKIRDKIKILPKAVLSKTFKGELIE